MAPAPGSTPMKKPEKAERSIVHFASISSFRLNRMRPVMVIGSLAVCSFCSISISSLTANRPITMTMKGMPSCRCSMSKV